MLKALKQRSQMFLTTIRPIWLPHRAAVAECSSLACDCRWGAVEIWMGGSMPTFVLKWKEREGCLF